MPVVKVLQGSALVTAKKRVILHKSISNYQTEKFCISYKLYLSFLAKGLSSILFF